MTRCDVLVVGAGGAGLAAACALRDGAAPASVVLCDAGHLGHGPQRSAPGLVLPDLLDPWGRVAHTLGDAACAELHAFAASGPAWLDTHLGSTAGVPVDVWYVPASEGEWEDLQRTAPLFADWGVPHALVAARPPRTDGPLDPEAAALIRRGVRWVARARLVEQLGALARSLGAEVREACPITALHGDADGVRADTPTGPIHATVAIVACEGATGRVLPAVADAVRPWRGQGLRARGPMLEHPLICNYGHEAYLPRNLGALGLEIEVAGLNPSPGEADCTMDPTPTDRFQGFLQSSCELRLNARTGVRFSHPWAAPTALTPDGLPLVGALPGRPAVLVAAGFHGRGLAWGIAAGTALAQRIRGGPDRVPPRLAPRRFLGG